MLSRTQRIRNTLFSAFDETSCGLYNVLTVLPRSLSIPSDQRVKERKEKLTCEEKYD